MNSHRRPPPETRLTLHDLLREIATGATHYKAGCIYVQSHRITIKIGEFSSSAYSKDSLIILDNLALDQEVWKIYRQLVRGRFAPPAPAPPKTPEIPPVPPVPPVPYITKKQKVRWKGLFGDKPRLTNARLDKLLTQGDAQLLEVASDMLFDLMLARRQLSDLQQRLKGQSAANDPDVERDGVIAAEKKFRAGTSGRKPTSAKGWYRAGMKRQRAMLQTPGDS